MNLHRRGFACLLVLLLSACSSDANAPSQNDPGAEQDISNVIYVGGVTDEALERMLDVTPKNDPRQAVIVDAPDLSAPVPRDSAATFRFHLATEAKHTPGSQHGTGKPPSVWKRGVRELLQFLAPERIAHAHGTPYNGTAYYLVITDKDSKPILQVFTPETSFTPETVDWQHLTDAPQPLTLNITSAFFEDNSVPVDGGPFIGGSFQFRIE